MMMGTTGATRPEGLVVIGEGKVSALPDLVVLTLGIENSAGNAVQALNESSTRMLQAAQAFISRGVNQADVQHAWVNVYPVYGQAGQAQAAALAGAAGPSHFGQAQSAGLGIFPQAGQSAQAAVPQVGGFLVSRGLRVLWRDPGRLGEIIDITLATGITSIWGISFTLQDESRVRYAALEAAGKDARAKAEIAAVAMGRRPGPPTSFVEEHIPLELGLAAGDPALGSALKGVTGRTPALPGDLTFTARVRVTYELV